MEEGGRRAVDELNRRMAEANRRMTEQASQASQEFEQEFEFMTGRPWPRNLAAAQLVVQSHSEKKARVAVQSSLGKRASPEADLERQRDQAQRERDLAVFQCTVKEKQRDLAQKQCTAVKKELDLARDKLKHTQEELKDAHALVARGVQASNVWRKNFNEMQQHFKEAQQERDELQKSLLQMRGRNLFDLPDAQLEGLLEDIMVAKERVEKMQLRRKAEERVLEAHPDYRCPISLALMRDPVVTDDGQSYEREEIEAWFKKLREAKEPITSPLRAPLMSAQLVSNQTLRRAIEAAVHAEEPNARALSESLELA
jgi:hypothetical protein